MIIPKKINIEKYVLKYFMQKRFILDGNTIKISLKFMINTTFYIEIT